MFKKADVEALVEMSDKLDSEGNHEEAKRLDVVIASLVRLAEKEKEEEEGKGARQMSGKAKAKFRTLRKAVESLIQADLDYRGPHKNSCRKVEMLAEEILEALKDCDFE